MQRVVTYMMVWCLDVVVYDAIFEYDDYVCMLMVCNAAPNALRQTRGKWHD